MVTGAVHAEVAHDCSTDGLILCLRNFMNLRGKPRCIWSDNGTNFIGFDGETANVPDFFDWGRIQENFAPPRHAIEWKFNTPMDPSAGGAWERLVQSIKKVLKAVMAERYPHEHTFRSFLLEAVNIVNSRPLTHLPVGADEQAPLTPNHFLIGHTNSTQAPTKPDEKLGCLRKQWRISQLLKNHFWSRWVSEYLPVLGRRCKWQAKAPPLTPGQLVLICDPDAPRNEWKRGVVLEVVLANDGQTRSAKVQTSTGVYRRPAHKLAVLDIVGETPSLHGGGRVVDEPLQPALVTAHMQHSNDRNRIDDKALLEG